ncbi:tetratricopeptide repeat protein 23-like isoform 2-T4 [Thomomys bottae]
MPASPIYIPTVTNDTDWNFCFHLSQQNKNSAHQRPDELCFTYESRESEEESRTEEEENIDCMSLPKEKLAQSQKKIVQLIKEKMNIQANKELIRCVILSRIVFGQEHWKCAEALANLAYGYLTLRGFPAQAKKHAESAKNKLLALKGNMASDEEEREILGVMILLYYTLGMAWLLQKRGKEAYFYLQKADRTMKELTELNKGYVYNIQVTEKDLEIGLGRASLAIHRLNLALSHFEKAIDDVIAAKGVDTSDLISLYEEIAQMEQLRRNHGQAIQYLKQAYSICVSSFTENSPQTGEVSALLAKAYAMSGEPQHRDAVEIYFVKSISAYKATLGPEDCETLATIEEFCKWLVQNGNKQGAYRLLKASLKSYIINYGVCNEKVAETLYNMSRICFPKGEIRKAIQMLRKIHQAREEEEKMTLENSVSPSYIQPYLFDPHLRDTQRKENYTVRQGTSCMMSRLLWKLRNFVT